MKKGFIQIFCGEGRGKSTAAIGKGIQAASAGKSVIIIQFLKGCQGNEIGFIQRLEPEIKLFRFERSEGSYLDLTPEQREEESQNIRNGLNFARKVISTQGCDVLILDEVLGLPAAGIISSDEIISLIESAKSEEMDLILTGINQDEEYWELADEVTVMQMKKHENSN